MQGVVDGVIEDIDAGLSGSGGSQRTLATYITPGVYTISSEEMTDYWHVARVSGAGTVYFDISSVPVGALGIFEADYATGFVSGGATGGAGVMVLPNYYFRNISPRDGNLLSPLPEVLWLRPGDVVWIMRLTTNEFHVVGSYRRPSYVPIGTQTNIATVGTGKVFRDGDRWSGWYIASIAASGDTTIDLSALYSGDPVFTGAETVVLAIQPVGPTGFSPLITHKSSGAGTIVLNNAEGVIRLIRITFGNLSE